MRASAVLTCLAAVAMAAPAQITMNPGVGLTSRKQAHTRGASTMYFKLDPVDDHLILYNCTELARGGSVKCHKTKLNTTLSDLYEPVDRFEWLAKGASAFCIVWMCAYVGIELALFLFNRIEPSQVLNSDQICNGDDKVPHGDDKIPDEDDKPSNGDNRINYEYGSDYGYEGIDRYESSCSRGIVIPSHGRPYYCHIPAHGSGMSMSLEDMRRGDATHGILNKDRFSAVFPGSY